MVSYSGPPHPGGEDDKERLRNTQIQLFGMWSCQVYDRDSRKKVTGLGPFLTFPGLHWLSCPCSCIASDPGVRRAMGGRGATGLLLALTVMMSFSTQSGATLCRWVRCSCRWILLLSMSWHKGQRSMGCTECCVMACTRSRLTSALLYLQ